MPPVTLHIDRTAEFDFEDLKAALPASKVVKQIEQVLREKDYCKHPGCGCVCGHQRKCPEDGPTAGISDAICD